MIYCKETQTDGFPYGGLITKLLGAFNNNTMGEAMESLINNIYYSSLRNMKIHIEHGELSNDWTDEEDDLEESDNSAINNIMEIYQQNNLSIRGLVKYVEDIKRIISRNDDTHGK